MKKQKLNRQHSEPMTNEEKEAIRELIRSMVDRVKSDNPGHGGEGLLLDHETKEIIGRLWHLNLTDPDDPTFQYCERLYKGLVSNPEQVFRFQLQYLDVDHFDHSKTDMFKIVLNPNYNLFSAPTVLEYYKQAGREYLNVCGRDIDLRHKKNK